MSIWSPYCSGSVYGEAAVGYDCGDNAAAWLARFLELEDVRLYYSHKDIEKRKSKNAKKESCRLKAREHDQVRHVD